MALCYDGFSEKSNSWDEWVSVVRRTVGRLNAAQKPNDTSHGVRHSGLVD